MNYMEFIAEPPLVDPSVLLLHFEAGLTDSSPYGRTVTGYNGAAASATRAKWGTNAFTTDGNDRLQTVDATELRFGDGEWSMDCWLYVPSSVTLVTDNCIAGKWTTTGGNKLSWFWELNVFGRLAWGYSIDGTTLQAGTFWQALHAPITRDQWVHAALWRSKAAGLDRVYAAFDGIASNIHSTSIGTLHGNAAPVSLFGVDYTSAASMPSGVSMDEFRMVTGSCPFLHGNFTPPTGPYP